MSVWSFLLHFPKLQPSLHFQLSFKPSCISWASTWPKVILFITEIPCLFLFFKVQKHWIWLPLEEFPCLHQVYDNFFSRKRTWKIFCLYVSLCLSVVWQLKHLHLQLTEMNAQLQDAFLRLQEEKVLGSNTLGNTKTHLYLVCLQTSPRHYISFDWFLFSSEVGLFRSFSDSTLLDTLFVVFLFLPSAIVVSLFWFQASCCRRIY